MKSRVEREALALTKRCPTCRVQEHFRCRTGGVHWKVRKHPHDERMALVKEED